MEKIKDLLKQIGATQELTESILNELKSFHTRTKKQLDEEFHARLEKAKQVCLEEFDKEKVKLYYLNFLLSDVYIDRLSRENVRTYMQ